MSIRHTLRLARAPVTTALSRDSCSFRRAHRKPDVDVGEVVPGASGTIWFHRGDLPGTTALLVCAGRTQFAFLMNGNAGSRENAERILTTLLDAAREVEDWPARDPFPRLR